MHRHQRLILGIVATLMVGLGIGIPLGRQLLRTPIDGGPARPIAYQILYRTASSPTGSKPKAGWELLTVQRPFVASDLDYSVRPAPGSEPEGGSAFTRDRLYAFASGGFQLISDRQPGAPGYDQDLLTQMPDLLSRHLVSDLGRSETVSGRSCELYRFLEPPSGAVAPLSSSQHDDICIDSQGLELAETWYLKGTIVETRRAAAVTVGSVRPPFSPSGSARLPGSAVAAARLDPKPNSFLPSPPIPTGFQRGEPEDVIEANPQQAGQLEAAEVVWYFVRGPDVITVEAGENAPGQLPWDAEATVTRAVRLTRLGAAQSAIRSDGAELRINLGDGQWIRIRGTVPLVGLVAYADTLAPPA
ncbi:MAG TPA: hypothetical protein VMU63_01925 [Acidimicrobiales bacterium]|nr:hypothetical protein [Acidimicrobiales bacterium]